LFWLTRAGFFEFDRRQHFLAAHSRIRPRNNAPNENDFIIFTKYVFFCRRIICAGLLVHHHLHIVVRGMRALHLALIVFFFLRPFAASFLARKRSFFDPFSLERQQLKSETLGGFPHAEGRQGGSVLLDESDHGIRFEASVLPAKSTHTHRNATVRSVFSARRMCFVPERPPDGLADEELLLVRPALAEVEELHLVCLRLRWQENVGVACEA
jgi:hypothetical protein